MSIEYYASHPCPVRDSVSDEALLTMEKARTRASCVVELMRSHPGTPKDQPEEEWTFITQVLRPDGPVQVEVKIGDLLAESAPLDALARHCAGCVANHRNADFGCGGAINYPISAAAEQWLLSRLPDDLKSARGQLLLQAIADFDYDGACIDAARSRKELYASSTAPVRKWGGFFARKTVISSSQILHMIIPVGHLQPAHAKMLGFFLGYLDDEFEYRAQPDNLPQPGDDECTAQFKRFVFAAAHAGVHGVPVFMDT
ncbi:hypothetical protein [Chitinilyticum aquatile]|uniref:hypothetical protein n=1 Tax=Chitinilyticum aquatile TaxID=362520 RepID=UPI000416AFE0|nr:hypothetical protein [Chitinilyticum aquatile]